MLAEDTYDFTFKKSMLLIFKICLKQWLRADKYTLHLIVT